jgi:hypothetical protein
MKVQSRSVSRIILLLASTGFCIAPVATAQTTAPTTRPYAPAQLPGKGLDQHPFMYAGEALPLQVFIVRDGKIAWSYTHPGAKGEISDATMLSNGNVVFAYQFGAAEVSPEKKVIWSHEAAPGCEIHTAQPIGNDRVLFVQNGDPAKLSVVNTVTGATEKEFVLPTKNPKSVHGQFRHARYTPAGTFLVVHMDMGKVCEYDNSGKEIWSYDMPGAWSASRLKNGNTLVVSGRNIVREVSPQGQTVWELTQSDVPDFRLFNTQTACRLDNGNTVISNWKSPDKENQPVQFLEVTPQKQVVWALRSWTDPANLGRSTNIQLLDEPGKAEDGELQR